MLRRNSGFLIWVLIATAVAVIPLACGGDDSSSSSNALQTPDAMTKD